jgi:hypothetical protein
MVSPNIEPANLTHPSSVRGLPAPILTGVIVLLEEANLLSIEGLKANLQTQGVVEQKGQKPG